MSAIRLRDLVFSRPSGRVLAGVDLELGGGERIAIQGPSGSGKTTLLRLVAGLERPERGEVTIDGRLVSSADGRLVPPHLRSLGYVFQEAALWPHMRVVDHLRFAAGPRDRAAREPDFEALLALVGLAGKENRYPDELSGGEARRVGLARALAARPACLLMDEPLTSLDHRLRDEMLSTIDRAVEHLGASLIYVTHEPAEAEALASRVLYLEGGRLQPAPAE